MPVALIGTLGVRAVGRQPRTDLSGDGIKMRRFGKILAWTVGVLIGLPLGLVVIVLLGANTGPGRHVLERLTPTLTGGTVRIGGLGGRFPDRLQASQVELLDGKGAYLTANGVVLNWSPLALAHKRLEIDQLSIRQADFTRMPLSSGAKSSGSTLPTIVHTLAINRLDIAPAVAGHAAAFEISGSAALLSTSTAQADLKARRLDGGGQYSLRAATDPTHLSATLTAEEPDHGLISTIANLPDLGPVTINAALDGPRDAVGTHVIVHAGPLQAQAGGTVDLDHEAADVTLTASAPAMTPRPDISWQDVGLNAHVRGPFSRPEITGQLRSDAVRAYGAAITHLRADIGGNRGEARLHATLEGLVLPGQDPSLFAGAPVILDATAKLDAANRPVEFSLHHPLIEAHGTAQTAGALAAQAAITLPDFGPISAANGANLQGRTALNLNVAQREGTTSVALNGTIGITGGLPQAQALMGEAARLDLAARLSGHDAYLDRLHLAGRGVDLTANGALADARADLHWTLAIADLALLQPTLTGRIDASGQVSGPEEDLSALAELRGNIGARGVQSGPVSVKIAAQGLPNQPSGTITAEGALLGAPVNLALAVSRDNGAVRLAVQRGAWKSLNAEGDLVLPAGARVPQGTLRLRMERLADLTPLLGRPLSGRVAAVLESNQGAAKLTMTAEGAGMPGVASVSRAALDANVTDPTANPSVRATLSLSGITASGITGGAAKLDLRGPQDALAMTLAATAPNLAGAPARVNAAATLDVPRKRVALNTLDAVWKQQPLRLLAPARLDLAGGGVAVDRLRLGLRSAVLEVNGRASPTLDLTARLQNLPADIGTIVSPNLAIDGTISADARLTGSTTRPMGTVRLTATGLRQRGGPGRALPPANLTVATTLNGTLARVDARLAAGPTNLTATGTAPLGASGALDLRTAGSMDLAMLDPILTAQGRRVHGRVSVDAAIAGTVAAPRVTGTARLANGAIEDFGLGVHITNVAASFVAEGDRVRITQFTGRAGAGTLGVGGTVSLAQPMPVDLRFTAANARPIASDLLTVTLDSQMTIQGNLQGDLNVAGTLHVRRAEVQIPDTIPASVAVLPVRTAGAPPPKPAPPAPPSTPMNIALNITLDAPQQVFVRGRGMDVELGGRVHIRGTASRPLPDGGLTLRRGTFSLAGTTLNFTAGSIDFVGAGLGNPALHLVATSTANNIVATLTISGDAKNPKITLSSVPELPQDEILAQLLFGQAEDRLGPLQAAQMAAALAQLSGAMGSGGGPLAGLRNKLGLDRLSMGSTATGTPTVEAGRYIARGVYLGARQATSGGGTQATVQVDLTKRLKLETSAGNASMTNATGAASSGQAASVGLKYQFEY